MRPNWRPIRSLTLLEAEAVREPGGAEDPVPPHARGPPGALH